LSSTRAKALVKLLVLHRLAPVQRNGFAVFAHPDQVVAKVGFHPLLLEVQLDLRAGRCSASCTLPTAQYSTAIHTMEPAMVVGLPAHGRCKPPTGPTGCPQS
jgi:hypothetical protein